MEKSRQTAAIGVPPGVSLTPSRTTRSLGWCNDGCASCGLRQGGPGLSSVNVDGPMDMDHRRRDPDGTPREGKPGLVGSERSHWDLLRCWSSALARLLLGAGYFRAAREEDRGRPVEAGKRRDEGARARGREGTVVGAPGEEEGEGRSRWDRCGIADRPAAAVAEFRTPSSRSASGRAALGKSGQPKMKWASPGRPIIRKRDDARAISQSAGPRFPISSPPDRPLVH